MDTPPSGEELQPSSRRKPRKPRGKGLRTTTGCAVCRSRHMKCDEAKPICGPCGKGNRPCVYKAPEKTARSNAAKQRSPSATEPLHNIVIPSHPSRIPDLGHSIDHDGRKDCHAAYRWGILPDGIGVSSPQSVLAGTYTPNTASLRWLGLLADEIEPKIEQHARIRSSTRPQPSSPDLALVSQIPGQEDYSDGSLSDSYGNRGPAPLFSRATSPVSPLDGLPQVGTHFDGIEAWQRPVHLLPHEIPIFRRFVTRLGAWIDTFDPLHHFQQLVPQLAMNNEGLLKAILAMASRHMALMPDEDNMQTSHILSQSSPGGSPVPIIDRMISVEYYQDALKYIQSSMRYESYNRSPELLATVLIISAYEMIDGEGKGWERHLKGVFWIQRSQDINGESGGIKQAIWWNWLRQDVWAALWERRRCYTIFKPTKLYCDMTQYDLASRAVFLLAQAVNYRSDEEIAAGQRNLQARIDRGDILLQLLEEWKRNLSPHFRTLPIGGPTDSAFTPLWICPSGFGGAALQQYHLARVLVLAHQPNIAGLVDFTSREKEISDAIDELCAIAIALVDESSILTSTGCLRGAGVFARGNAKRETIIGLLKAHQSRTGWPPVDLDAEMRFEWARMDAGNSS